MVKITDDGYVEISGIKFKHESLEDLINVGKDAPKIIIIERTEDMFYYKPIGMSMITLVPPTKKSE